MKSVLFFLFMAAPDFILAQKPVPPTESFTVTGKIKKEMTVTLADLSAYTSYSTDSITITNHLHERRGVLKNVKGILLKDVLEKAQIDEETPKVLSEYYINCIASDNYKVVFSWNEIFNSSMGKTVFILTGHDGKPASAQDNRIALISSMDEATGRRYVKGLQKIVVERVK